MDEPVITIETLEGSEKVLFINGKEAFSWDPETIPVIDDEMVGFARKAIEEGISLAQTTLQKNLGL